MVEHNIVNIQKLILIYANVLVKKTNIKLY